MSAFRILNPPPVPPKEPLPQGRINVRFRQMRGVYQVFAGRTYLLGASGDTPSEAIEELRKQYACPEELQITIH